MFGKAKLNGVKVISLALVLMFAMSACGKTDSDSGQADPPDKTNTVSVLVEPVWEYDDVFCFSEGLAMAKKDGKWGILQKNS